MDQKCNLVLVRSVVNTESQACLTSTYVQSTINPQLRHISSPKYWFFFIPESRLQALEPLSGILPDRVSLIPLICVLNISHNDLHNHMQAAELLSCTVSEL
jgi:hypothetical protein